MGELQGRGGGASVCFLPNGDFEFEVTVADDDDEGTGGYSIEDSDCDTELEEGEAVAAVASAGRAGGLPHPLLRNDTQAFDLEVPFAAADLAPDVIDISASVAPSVKVDAGTAPAPSKKRRLPEVDNISEVAVGREGNAKCTVELHDMSVPNRATLWTLEVSGAEVTVTITRNGGATPESKSRTFESNDGAIAFATKVIESKLSKGCVLASDDAGAVCLSLGISSDLLQQRPPKVATATSHVHAKAKAPALTSTAAAAAAAAGLTGADSDDDVSDDDGSDVVAHAASRLTPASTAATTPTTTTEAHDDDDDDDDEAIPISVAINAPRTTHMAGHCFCLTGTLSTTRKHWEEIVYLHGGTAAPRVSKHVTHVVCGEVDGLGTAKHTAALQRGIPTVDEQYLLRLIKYGSNKKKTAAAVTPATTAAGALTAAVAVSSSSSASAAAASSKVIGQLTATARDLRDGEEFEWKRQGADPYLLKNTSGVYSCTCQAWRFQNKPINLRTCRHLKELRGEDREIVRTQAPPAPTGGPSTAATAAASPSSSSSGGVPGVMLAHNYTPGKPIVGYWMSEKLDGVRAFWNGKNFLSRLGNVFDAPDWFKRCLPSHALDGELWAGRKMFANTISVVRSAGGSDRWKTIKYLVFDIPDDASGFEARYERMKTVVTSIGADHVALVEQVKVRDDGHLTGELRRVEALGGEGLMLRQPGSKYERGRSHSLLKVKTFHDAEALVVGHEMGRGKHGGRMGAVYCQLPDGRKFKVGTGFTDAERADPPKINTVITFKYQELTPGGIPRFPAFVRLAPDAKWPPASPWPPK